VSDVAEMMNLEWSYVLSRDSRLKKRREWREYGGVLMIFENTFGLVGAILSLGFLVLFAMWMWGRL